MARMKLKARKRLTYRKLLRGGRDIQKKHPAAVALGRLGGLKGGPARAERLPPTVRKTIAKMGAAARWG